MMTSLPPRSPLLLPADMRISRRNLFMMMLGGACCFSGSAFAADTRLSFDELYSKVSVLGLEFSQKVNDLHGKSVVMEGFMAPPLKAEANFFVLTEIPMSICPFCSSDADWPDNIVVVYLGRKQTFVQAGKLIAVSGRLDVGSWTDQETGFVSRLRIVDAQYKVV